MEYEFLTKFFWINILDILLFTKMVKKIKPLCVMLPRMSAYRRDFDETKYIKKIMNCQKNIMKFGIKSSILLKKDLVVNLFLRKII